MKLNNKKELAKKLITQRGDLFKEMWEAHMKEFEEELWIDDMVWEEHLKEVEEEIKLEEELCK
jgi:3-methyladenine DNA glycosylase/8-oxoguanine DNA glycosylase